MKHLLPAFILLACILTLMGCKDNEQAKLPDPSSEVSEFATIPSVKSMFLALENLGEPGPATFDLDGVSPAPEDSIAAAFAWGVLFANLQMAVHNRDEEHLSKNLKQMEALSGVFGLEEITAKLLSNVSPMISRGDWPALENTFYNTQYSIEQALFDQERHEIYTLMELGSWVEVTHEFARLADLAYAAQRSALLIQEGPWQYLEQNLAILSKEKSPKSPFFNDILDHVRGIRECLESSADGFLEQAKVERLMELTKNIKAELSIN